MHDDLDMIEGAISEEYQHLTFIVNNETFAIAVLDIKEIIEYTTITRVPQMCDFIAGVTNVRGKVIPVVDLSSRFGFIKTGQENVTCIIVETSEDGEKFEIGLMVDAVDQVYPIMPEDREESPDFGARIRRDFISHMAKISNGFVSVLNISKILSVDELSQNCFTYEIELGQNSGK